MREENELILYGLSGAETQYRVLRYTILKDIDPNRLARDIRYAVSDMLIHHPGVKYVYLMNNRPGLRREYYISWKKNTIESCAIFKDTLEREGLKIRVV